MPSPTIHQQARPILLFDDECGVCRRTARWVQGSARLESGESSIIVRPIGADPDALRSLNRDLDIWKAYATIHLLMPDGSMKLGGEAVAEVLRNLGSTKWFSWSFAISIFGFRPFQMLLNLAYVILADVRPIFGCESCGTPSPWVKPIHWMFNWRKIESSPTPQFTSLLTGHRPS
jgi:hypothetical protein